MCVMLQSIASVYTAAFKPANTEGRAGKVTKMKIDARTINLQSLEDTQVEYISQKYT